MTTIVFISKSNLIQTFTIINSQSPKLVDSHVTTTLCNAGLSDQIQSFYFQQPSMYLHNAAPEGAIYA